MNKLKKLSILTIFSLLFSLSLGFSLKAAETEEPVGLSLEGETVSESDAVANEANVIAEENVQAPLKEELETKITEEAAVKKPSPFSFSPTLKVTPIGVKWTVPYFSIVPGISFSGGAKTSNGQLIDMYLNYNFTFWNYLGANTNYYISDNHKEYSHDASLGLSWNFEEKWTAAIDGELHYKVVSNNIASGDNEIWTSASPSITYQAHPKVSLRFAANLGFWQAKVDTTNAAGDTRFEADAPDPEDLRFGGGFIYSPVDVSQIGLISDPFSVPFAGVPSYQLESKQSFFEPRVDFSVNIKALEGTECNALYRYGLPIEHNQSAQKRVEHKVIVGLNQDLWQGGSGYLSYSIRYRSYPNQYISDADANKYRLRQDINVGVNHSVNSYISLGASYTFKRRDSNKVSDETNFNKYEKHAASLSTTFKW